MSAPLAIVIPTHNRHNTVKNIINKLISHLADRFAFYIFIFDSSPMPADDIVDHRVTYIHCPGENQITKAQICTNLLTSKYKDIKWILFTPDDDCFIPNDELFNKLLHGDYSCYSSLPAYVPSRYIMFKNKKSENDIRILQECWSHHVTISQAGVAPREQIDKFSSEGVASWWGLYSREGFIRASVFRSKLLLILPNKFISIAEDLANLHVLSFKWLNVSYPLLCLRGDDRRFSKSKKYIPSWIVFDKLQEEQNKNLFLEVVNTFRDHLNESLAITQGVDSSTNISDCINLIRRHVNGYHEGRSRLYNLNTPVILRKDNYSRISFYYDIKKFHRRLLRKVDQLITMPWNRSDLDVKLYPNSYLYGDESIVDAIYSNKDFLFSDRDS